MKILTCAFLWVVLISCKNETSEKPVNNQENVITTYYLIRHAEKDRSNPDNEDPELNKEGFARAQKWASILNDIDLDAIYSSNYKRTQQTALPISESKNIKVESYDPHKVYETNFFEKTKGKQILVVGHSNTIPAFVNHVLGEERYKNIPDSIDGRLYVITKMGKQSKSLILNLE